MKTVTIYTDGKNGFAALRIYAAPSRPFGATDGDGKQAPSCEWIVK